MKQTPITISISLSITLFDELEKRRGIISRSAYYRQLILLGLEKQKK